MKTRLIDTGWTAVGIVLGLLLLVISVFVLMPVVMWPSAVIGTAPFLALIFWLAWLVAQRVRGKLGGKSTALLVGAALPLVVLAGFTGR